MNFLPPFDDKDLIITDLELFTVPPRWLFLKISTADGISGWGEPVIEGRAATVKAAVEELKPYLLGRSAGRIEDIWQTLYRGGFYRGGPILMSAIAGIDQALWDIKGKALGGPGHQILGGAVRHQMPMYSWIGGDRPDDVAAAAKNRMDQGFRGVKMNGTPEMAWIETPAQISAAAGRLAAVRDAVGPDVAIGVDFHGRVHKGMIKSLARALEPFQPYFIEEPVLAEHNEAIAELRNFTPIPIATGERMFSRWDFKPLLQAGLADIIQPDLSHAGGISEVRRIAAMAEAWDVALAPHCPLGPIALAASLQVDFCSINAVIQESSLGIHYNEGVDMTDYMAQPEVFSLKDGCIPLLQGPGLGVEIMEDKVREMAAISHEWKNPVWRLPDGSIAEW